MNDDKISEVYKGEISTDSFQDRSRRRINWMCSQARGERVLDLGCSQGIASIILGREGFEVVGVDIQTSRIEYAQRDLAQESASTRSRVTFMVGEGTDLDFDDDSFDTVLLGEVLEHLVVPERILDEVARVLRPEGRVVITTPYGVLHHHDHKQTFYARPLLSLVGYKLEVLAADIEDGYFRIVAMKSAKGRGVSGQVLDGLLDAGDTTVRSIQESLVAARKTLLAKDRDLAEHDRRSAKHGRETADLQLANAKLSARVEGSRDDQLRLRRENAELTKKVEMIERLRQQMIDRRKTVDRLMGTVKKQRIRIGRLEQDRWKLRSDLAITRWKLNSLKARKWWRLGAVLSKARHNPFLVFRAWGVITGRSSLPPRPELSARPMVAAAQEISDRQALSLPSVPRALPVPRRLIPVAMWADDAVVAEFQHEWQVCRVDESNWLEVLDRDRPLLLIAVGSPGSAMQADTDAVAEIVAGFGSRQIPTVFWDTSRDFASESGLTLAKLFDVVFAVSPDVEDHYRRVLGDYRVHNLPFSAQTAIYNPSWIGERDHRIVAFADNLLSQSWDSLDPVMGAAFSAGLEVLTDGSLPPDSPLEVDINAKLSTNLPAAPKVFKVALVGGGSGEVCPPAVFQFAATNTPIVMPQNKSVKSLFNGSVLQPTTDKGAANTFRALLRSDTMRARQSHSALRTVVRNHTTSDRVDDILAHAGVGNPKPERLEPISIVIPTNRPQQLDHLLESVGRQSYPNLELVLVLHGIEIDEQEIIDKAAQRGISEVQVLSVGSDVVLGEVFNRGFSATSHRRMAKMDDDDYYGIEYLHDLSDAQRFSKAEIVGKWAHYAYIEDVNAMIFRYGDHEHRYREVLAISTLLLDRSVFESVNFPPIPVGSGSIFLKAAAAEGVKTYAADRFNYLYMRYSDPAHHTFPIDDLHLTNAELVCYGLNVEHVTV